jgi:hypothetical protein
MATLDCFSAKLGQPGVQVSPKTIIVAVPAHQIELNAQNK